MGYNKKKTHPILDQLESDCYSQHAELDAILKFISNSNDTKGTVLFVARLTRTDKVSLAKPCNACQELIEKYGIKKVYFTNYYGEMEEMKAA